MSPVRRLILLPLIVCGLIAAPAQQTPAPSPEDGRLYSDDGNYVFPLAGDPDLMVWSRYHWDGSGEVDIEAAPGIAQGSRTMERFESLPVVAVTAGEVRRADNERGGIALWLDGDDQQRYYYSHLSESVIEPGETRRVTPGQRLGTIGRTGRWSQYIETHLHFSVHDFQGRELHGADWILNTFGLSPRAPEPEPYLPDRPRGAPVRGEYDVVSGFGEKEGSDLASIEILLSTRRPVTSVLTGEVRTMRNTVFGRRIQVTNRHTDQTVVISGIDRFTVRTGDVVHRGQVIGWGAGRLNIMYFDEGILRDPLVMFMPAEEADHPGEEED